MTKQDNGLNTYNSGNKYRIKNDKGNPPDLVNNVNLKPVVENWHEIPRRIIEQGQLSAEH